jgi:hypothetical protein
MKNLRLPMIGYKNSGSYGEAIGKKNHSYSNNAVHDII